MIARLLDGGPQVLATGGGAVMNQQTRDLIHIKGLSVWLKADLDVLLRRTRRRSDRPLADRMKELLPLREPVYAQSDIIVQSRDEPHETIVEEIIAGVAKHLDVAGSCGETDYDRAAAHPRNAPMNRSWCRSRSARAPMRSSSAAD